MSDSDGVANRRASGCPSPWPAGDTVVGGRPEDAFQAALGLASLSAWGCSPVLRFLSREGPAGVWQASRRSLEEWGLSAGAVARFCSRRRAFRPGPVLEAMAESHLTFVPYGHAQYPAVLSDLAYPPAGLFVRGVAGAMTILNASARIAIVGTRRATPYGRRAADHFGMAFAENGVAVISGMAFGIDGRAHQAALDVGGFTVAVLGCGADIVYPPRHRSLYEQIVASGMIISELPPGCAPARWTFPHRNRVLAALADAVLVVEGAKTSGALQTATWGLELGRQVMAVPGPIMVEAHQGCNALLYDGAIPALDPRGSVEDFFRATGIERGKRGADRAAGRAAAALTPEGPSSAVAGRIMQALRSGCWTIDGLVTETGLSAREVNVCLARLELAREVGRAGVGWTIRGP